MGVDVLDSVNSGTSEMRKCGLCTGTVCTFSQERVLVLNTGTVCTVAVGQERVCSETCVCWQRLARHAQPLRKSVCTAWHLYGL
jgi:hypothetical protein